MSSGSSQPCDHPRDSNSHCSFEVLENGNFDGFDHWETVIFDVMQMGFFTRNYQGLMVPKGMIHGLFNIPTLSKRNPWNHQRLDGAVLNWGAVPSHG